MKRILIPTDFSEVANSAVLYAMALTQNTKAKYIFFHAGEEGESVLKQNIRNVAPIVEVLKDNVEYLSVNMDFKLETIKEIIKHNKIDLIIMGTHGSKALLSSKIFGSKTTAVIEEINVPVIAVPPNYSYNGISKVAYAADMVNLFKELDKLIPFVKEEKAALEIVHVKPVFPDFANTEKINFEELINETIAKYDYPNINYFVEVTKCDNQTAKGIEDYVRSHSPDLLAIFHINRSWLDRVLMPSTTSKEVARIKVPILVFPKEV